MSVSYQDFLQSAEALLNNKESTEIDFRNLISRSYYAVFLLSREIAETLPNPIGDNYDKLRSHEKVIIKFSKHDNFARIGYLIKQRKLMREKADYENHLDIIREESAKHFFESKALISKLENLKQ